MRVIDFNEKHERLDKLHSAINDLKIRLYSIIDVPHLGAEFNANQEHRRDITRRAINRLYSRYKAVMRSMLEPVQPIAVEVPDFGHSQERYKEWLEQQTNPTYNKEN